MLSCEALRNIISYDASSSIFTWKGPASFRNTRGGKVAGTKKGGRIAIGLPGMGQMLAHRLAWFYSYGEMPSLEVDHKDGNPLNNRLDNLRLATSSQQKQNKIVQSNNRSGLKGAYFHACHKGKKWRSQIKTPGGLKFLGYFHTAEEAHEVYVRASETEFGEFACSGIRAHQARLDSASSEPRA